MTKKRLFLASALMLGMSFNAMAQEENQKVFFYGFEDGPEAFSESAQPVDSITEILYYAGNPIKAGWDITYKKDSVIYIKNSIDVYSKNAREDKYEIVDDIDGSHTAELKEYGAQGGDKYLKYIAGGDESSSEVSSYYATLYLRGIQVEPQTSYRLTYYTKATKTGAMYASLMRGYYNSDKNLSMTGASGSEFSLHKQSFNDEQWERVTTMSYYQNDSVAERHMHNAGYSWTKTWATTNDKGMVQDYIKQFDKFFIRLSFTGPNATYYVDDVTLYKSMIAGAEYNSDMIRVDFGYETNIAKLASVSEFSAVELPEGCITVTGIDENQGSERMEIPVASAEYHTDGYLYIWLDDECDWYSDILVNFKNPEDEKFQLKYTGSLYPMALNEEWVNNGKIVPDLENEFVSPNPNVYANSIASQAPVIKGSNPEDGSFNLDQNTREIKVYMTKKPYVDTENNTETTENGVIAMVQSAGGKEYWLAGEWNAEEMYMTFVRQSKYTKPLKGDYTFTIINARAMVNSDPAENYTVNLTFGDLTEGAPTFYYRSEVEWTKDNVECESIPFGWTVTDGNIGAVPVVGDGTAKDGCSRMYFFNDGGQFTRGMYLSARTSSPKIDGTFIYGTVPDYMLRLPAGDYWLSFKAFGWGTASSVYLYIYPYGSDRPEEHVLKFKPDNTVSSSTAKDNYTVDCATEYLVPFTVEAEDYYVIDFKINYGNSSKADCIGGIEISNQYSSAYKYLQQLIDARELANNKILFAEATAAKYAGASVDNVKEVLKKYESFSSTYPSEYNRVTKDINDAVLALQLHINTVDKYYDSYASAEAKRDQYADTIQNGLAAYAELVGKIKDYATMDPTKKTDDEIKAITEELTAAVQAVDDRVDNNEDFVKALANVLAILQDETNSLYADFDEYKNAQSLYNSEKDDNTITMTDEKLATATKALTTAKTKFDNMVIGVNVMTVQVKALAELAKNLAVDFEALKAGSTAEINAAVASVVSDDQNLANTLKEAIKYTLYKRIAAGEYNPASDTLDLTPFMQNYTLYSTAKVGSELEHYYYANSTPNDRYRIKIGIDFTTVFPGWTVRSNGGCVYAGNDKDLYADEDWAPIYDGSMTLATGSTVDIYNDITGLPAGKYTVAVGANIEKDGSMLMATANGVSDTIMIVNNDENEKPTAVNNYLKGIVTNDGNINVHYFGASGSGKTRVDLFATYLTDKADVDYSALAEKAKTAAVEAVNGVEAVEEVSSVKYYNINGVQTAQPKGVAIKVTTGKNGKVNAQKILVK